MAKPTPVLRAHAAKAYVERNRVLRSMGFPTYKSYLASDLWKSIRASVLRSNPNCHVCGRTATQAHHAAYRKKDLEGRDIRRIFSICAGCHFKAEFRAADGEKLSVKQAKSKMNMMRTLRIKEEHEKSRPLLNRQPSVADKGVSIYHDLTSGLDITVVSGTDRPWDGWILCLDRNGEWQPLREASEEDLEKIAACFDRAVVRLSP